MTLAVADSLMACPAFDLTNLMDRFVDWWREGRYSATFECFDIGVTTSKLLRSYLSLKGSVFRQRWHASAGTARSCGWLRCPCIAAQGEIGRADVRRPQADHLRRAQGCSSRGPRWLAGSQAPRDQVLGLPHPHLEAAM